MFVIAIRKKLMEVKALFIPDIPILFLLRMTTVADKTNAISNIIVNKICTSFITSLEMFFRLAVPSKIGTAIAPWFIYKIRHNELVP